MNKKGLSQEGLKLIAVLTMLLDHIGATIYPSMLLRSIGRLAFPIYCFLLAEGLRHTRSVKRYAGRLLIGAILSEIPFDLLFHGRIWYPGSQSVMLTLLLGLLMVWVMGKTRFLLVKAATLVFFCWMAELLHTDYGAMGVAMVALFALPWNRRIIWPVWILGMAGLCWAIGGAYITLAGQRVPVEMLAMPALIPIGLYSGKKHFNSPVIQTAFYLFYPVHLLVLYGILQWM